MVPSYLDRHQFLAVEVKAAEGSFVPVDNLSQLALSCELRALVVFVVRVAEEKVEESADLMRRGEVRKVSAIEWG